MPDPATWVSVKRWWVRWRARWSLPSLLAGHDERKIVSLVAAANGVIAILVISVLAWLTDLPLLFPALGPSAFILFSSPFAPAAAPRSVIMGHSCGIIAGFMAWYGTTLICNQPVLLETSGWPLFVSASLALAATFVLLVRLSCPHPPACATALIIGLGAATSCSALLGMVAGITLLAAQAVVMHRIANVDTPIWSPRPTHVDR